MSDARALSIAAAQRTALALAQAKGHDIGADGLTLAAGIEANIIKVYQHIIDGKAAEKLIEKMNPRGRIARLLMRRPLQISEAQRSAIDDLAWAHAAKETVRLFTEVLDQNIPKE